MDNATLADMPKAPTSIRLSDEARAILEEFSRRLGVTQSAVMELALRQFAGRVKLTPTEDNDAANEDSPDP